MKNAGAHARGSTKKSLPPSYRGEGQSDAKQQIPATMAAETDGGRSQETTKEPVVLFPFMVF